MGPAAGWESQRFVTLKNRAGDAAVGGHPVKRVWEMLRSGDMLCGCGSLRVRAAAGRNVKE